jgi:hypothetical protein
LIRVGDDLDWPVSGALFDWNLEFLAERLDDENARQRLQEIVDYNLGSLWLSEFDKAARRAIVELLRKDLIITAVRDLPTGDHKDAGLEQLRELATLAQQFPS